MKTCCIFDLESFVDVKKFFLGLKQKFLFLMFFTTSLMHAVGPEATVLLKSSEVKGSASVDLSRSLKSFVEQLDLLAQQDFPQKEVVALFHKILLSAEDLAPYIFYKKEFYTRNLIHASNDYELILLCWSPGQKSPVHGHEGQKCWMRVEQGSLEFTNYVDYQEDGIQKFKIINKQLGGVGFTDGPAYIHGVDNCTSEQAVSLHLYAKPFRQCDVFDVEHSLKRRANLGFYSVGGKLV